MRTIETILMIAILMVPAQLLFPWWSLAIVALAVGYVSGQKSGGAFLAGFFGAGSVWWVYAGYKHWHTHGILSDKIAALFHLPNGWVLVIVTGLLAAILGGLFCWSGRELRQLV